MPNGEHDDKGREGEFDGRTYLYIRTHPADNGSEPLPAALPGWQSPDITVIKPDNSRGSEAVAGQLNHVEVLVTNGGGLVANNAFVDVFFADPSTAFTPATANLIGSGYVTLGGYSMTPIAVPWTPGAADAGHRCLVARVALFVPPDTYADGTIFDVRGDRHVAQRNIHVVALAGAKSLTFAFAVVNPLLEPLQTRLVAREVRDAARLQELRAGLGCQFAQFGATPLPAVKVDVGRERIVVPAAEHPLALLDETFRLARLGPVEPRPLERPRNSLTMNMEAGEVHEAMLYLERNPETRPGDLHAVDIVQTDGRRTIIGGLTVVAVH